MKSKIYVYIKKGEDIKEIEILLQKASQGRELYYDLYTDFDRDYIAFNQLKRDIEKKAGILIISSINNIGSNKQDVYEQLLCHRKINKRNDDRWNFSGRGRYKIRIEVRCGYHVVFCGSTGISGGICMETAGTDGIFCIKS